jgi:4-hydroxy-4-methyl-2-oxoglutarate aldolase
VTVRNVPQVAAPLVNARERLSRAAEIEGHNQARPGDVLVIQGQPDLSNMGGISATIARRQGEAGAIVEGGVRDLGHMREIGFPVWSRSVSPITCKWRVETVEVNGRVDIAGISVSAGDLVVADETGVCFVPRREVERIAERCLEILSGEAQRHEEIGSGVAVADLAQRTYVYQYGEAGAG